MKKKKQNINIISNTLQEDNNPTKESHPSENSVKFRLYTEEISFEDFIAQKRKSTKVAH